jgi:hypothetical protein
MAEKPGTVPPGEFLWRTDEDLDLVSEMTPERIEKARANAAPKAKALTEAPPAEDDEPRRT